MFVYVTGHYLKGIWDYKRSLIRSMQQHKNNEDFTHGCKGCAR